MLKEYGLTAYQWDALPWYLQRMYREKLEEYLQAQSRSDEPGTGGGPESGSWVQSLYR